MRFEYRKLRSALRVFSLAVVLAILTYAARNYDVVLKGYARYWTMKSPVRVLEEDMSKPVVVLSVSHPTEGLEVSLLRTYAEPHLLEFTTLVKLYFVDEEVALFIVKTRLPVGAIQELAFLGSIQKQPMCVDLIVLSEGEEVVRWSDCNGSRG